MSASADQSMIVQPKTNRFPVPAEEKSFAVSTKKSEKPGNNTSMMSAKKSSRKADQSMDKSVKGVSPSPSRGNKNDVSVISGKSAKTNKTNK